MYERIKKLENAKNQQLKQAKDRFERNLEAMNTRYKVEISQIERRFDSEIHAAKLASEAKPSTDKLN